MKISLNDSSENKIIKSEEVDKPKRKIRSLVKREPNEVKTAPNQRRNYQIFVLSILVLIAGIYIYNLTDSCEFKAFYERTYNKIFHDDEYYCIRKINTGEIYENLQNEIVAQDEAIKLIRGSLEKANRDGFISVAFNGVIGVGKSLSAHIISRQFQWKDNIHKYLEGNRTEFLESIPTLLSKCGYNLFIFDNMDFNDTTIEFVKEIESILTDKSKTELYRIVLIIIFNGYVEKNDDVNPLQDLFKNFVIIDFYPLTLNDFIKCIEVHQRLYNIQISSEQFDELKRLDFENTGCKLISKRLNLIK